MDNLFHSNTLAFISDADFDYMVAAKHAAEEAIGWKLLPENIVYRVEKMSPIQTKWGSRCIIELRNAIGQDVKVWAPTNVVRDLKSGFKLNGKDCIAFIKSMGEPGVGPKRMLWVNQERNFLILKLYIVGNKFFFIQSYQNFKSLSLFCFYFFIEYLELDLQLDILISVYPQ